jgi:hypothetical protein
VRYVELHHLGRARRRPLTPQTVGQAIGRDRATNLQRKHRQDGTLLAGAERDGPAIEARLDRPEEIHVHVEGGLERPYLRSTRE